MITHVRAFAYNTLLLAAGGLICAVAVNSFLIPGGFLSSGMTGAALIVYYRYPVMSVGIIYFLINIPVFLLGYFFVGARFILYTMWGMFIYSVMLYLVNIQIPVYDNMLSAFIAGALTGLGVAIVLRSYGSGGGSEILCVILHKLFSITVGAGSIIINSIILIVSATLFPLDKVLYTFVYILISTIVTDMVFHGLAKRKAALIISDEWLRIVNVLTEDCRIGVTVIDGCGGYHGTEKTILYSVLLRRDIPLLKKVILDIDPNAFITIMEASDVTGVDVGNQPHW